MPVVNSRQMELVGKRRNNGRVYTQPRRTSEEIPNARLFVVGPGIHNLGINGRSGGSTCSQLRRGGSMCSLRRVGRLCIVGIMGNGRVSGGWARRRAGRARSALLGRVSTLLSDFSVYVAEVASDMTTLH